MSTLFNRLADDILTSHPIIWAERNVSLGNTPMRINNTGRDYLKGLYEYVTFIAPSAKSLPVIIVKGRKVEMSTTISVLGLYFMTSGAFDGVRGLHAFPFVDQSHSYSNAYFDPIVRISGLMEKRDPYGTYSVTHKQFMNGNQLFIEGASTEGKRLRGMTLDFVFFDEVQDMTRKAIENTREAMTHSMFGRPGMGMEVAFGTPTFKGSNFERMWEESDQRYYHLRCPNCDHYFMLTMEVCTYEYNVQCPECHKEYDKREIMTLGKWIPTRHDNVQRYGYHFSQLLVPYITIDSIRYKQDTMGAVQFANEVMGEFCSGGATPLSFEEVLAKMRDDNLGLRQHIFPTESRQYMGIDWGSRTLQDELQDEDIKSSYTTIVILTPLGEGQFRIEYCQLVLEEQELKEKVDLVEELWRNYSVMSCCADMGYGHNEVAALQRMFNDRVKGVWSSGNVKQTYTYDQNAFLLTINRDMVLTELFQLIKQGAIKLPFDEPTRVEWLVRHIVAMNVEASTVGGLTRLRYTKTSKPCDGLMALMYAYIAYRFDETQGFRNLHPAKEGRAFAKPRVARISRGRTTNWQIANAYDRTVGGMR